MRIESKRKTEIAATSNISEASSRSGGATFCGFLTSVILFASSPDNNESLSTTKWHVYESLSRRSMIYMAVFLGAIFTTAISVFTFMPIGTINATETVTPSETIDNTPAVGVSLSDIDFGGISTDSSGTVKTVSNTATINSSIYGYELYISSSDDTNSLVRSGTAGTSASEIIPATSTADITAPSVLSNDTWGFAAQRRNTTAGSGSEDVVANAAFDASYPTGDNSSANSKFAAIPTLGNKVLIAERDSSATNVPTNIYYGIRVTTDKPSGLYQGSVTYTAIGKAPTTHTVTIKTAPGISKVTIGETECTSSEGCEVTLTYGYTYDISATAATGYTFHEWNLSNTTGAFSSITSATTTFTAGKGDTVITPSSTPIPYTQTTYVRYQNANGTWTDYGVAEIKDVNYGSSYAWSRAADEIYQAASISSYTVTAANNNYVDVYRNKYTVDINSVLNGEAYGYGHAGFTFDVYIDGVLVADDVEDWASWAHGSSITDGYLRYGQKIRIVGNNVAGYTMTDSDVSRTITSETVLTVPRWTANTYTVFESIVYPVDNDYTVNGNNMILAYSASENKYTLTNSGSSYDPQANSPQTAYLVANTTYTVHADLVNTSGEAVSGNGNTLMQLFYAIDNAYSEENSVRFLNASNTVTFTPTVTGVYNLRFDNDYGNTLVVRNFSLGYSKTVTYGSTYGDLASPTKPGYDFIGWYNATSGGTQVKDTSIVSVANNQVLFATWQGNPIIQDFTKAMCEAQASAGNVTVRDRRDNNDYTVRYINGNCWMTSDLRITGTISATDSNFTGNNVNISAGDLTSGNSYDEPRTHTGTDGNGNPTVWYNYAAATAKTITGSSNSTSATQDICPKSWRLPTSSEQSGITSYKDAYSPVAGGNYGGGSLFDTGYGSWWSATAYNSTVRYGLGYGGGSLYTHSSYYRYNGIFVRCIRSS